MSKRRSWTALEDDYLRKEYINKSKILDEQ